MKYLFSPEHPGAVPASERGGSRAMRSGNVYDVSPEWAAIVCEGCPGKNGADCLIPVAVEPVDVPIPKDSAKAKLKKKSS